jgi:ribosomal protein L11 methyltransferase
MRNPQERHQGSFEYSPPCALRAPTGSAPPAKPSVPPALTISIFMVFGRPQVMTLRYQGSGLGCQNLEPLNPRTLEPYSPPVPKAWTAVIVTADPELADSVGSFLVDQGAPGLVIEELPDSVQITAHFKDVFSRDALDRFCAHLSLWFPGSPSPAIRVEPTQDWADNWKAHFPPLEIGKRLWVHPPWVVNVPRSRIAVVIDPGMAFGTGHHASTRGCLVYLDRLVRPDATQRVLDIGTGSGVLAIAAAKLGAARVWAVDTDLDACRIAAANANANGVGARVHVRSDVAAVDGTFDLVVANLFAGQLIEMARLIYARLARGGTAIGAGILAAEAKSVREAWQVAGLIAGDQLEESEWTTISARRH